jgi:hypothetical protein
MEAIKKARKEAEDAKEVAELGKSVAKYSVIPYGPHFKLSNWVNLHDWPAYIPSEADLAELSRA